MNRATARRTAVETLADVRFFLSRVAKAVQRGLIEVHAYCVMTTHFHLLLRSLLGHLDDAMHLIQNQYSRYFNRTRRRDGGLWRNRYLSKVVRSDAYRRNVIRYLDGNPLVAGVMDDPAASIRCSAHFYVGGKAPPWLCTSWVEKETAAEDYRTRFAPRLEPWFREWIEMRLEHRPGGSDRADFDDLVRAAPADVYAWMVQKAELADGTAPGQPILPAAIVQRLVASESRPIAAEWPPEEVIAAGLLRAVSGRTYADIARRVGRSTSTVHGYALRHNEALLSNHGYAEYASRLVSRCLSVLK
ncbi:MAG: transposase [Planctomycetota bacterium]|jgi:REP element-mobilizing transposase RayT